MSDYTHTEKPSDTEKQKNTSSLHQLKLLIDNCSETEAEAIIPAVESILRILRDENAISLK